MCCPVLTAPPLTEGGLEIELVSGIYSPVIHIMKCSIRPARATLWLRLVSSCFRWIQADSASMHKITENSLEHMLCETNPLISPVSRILPYCSKSAHILHKQALIASEAAGLQAYRRRSHIIQLGWCRFPSTSRFYPHVLGLICIIIRVCIIYIVFFPK